MDKDCFRFTVWETLENVARRQSERHTINNTIRAALNTFCAAAIAVSSPDLLVEGIAATVLGIHTMDIDAYQQCPCHAEKKIKFCCGKDIVTDLNQILAKNAAGQGLAALDQLDRAIKKSGPQDCLLTIQTHILLAHGEIEKAKQSNDLFLEKNPKHATGLHHRALIRLAEDDVAGAVDSLQDAMDAITGNEIPLSMAQAFRVVGIGLMQDGHLVAARAHLNFANDLKNGRDAELSRMIMETFRTPSSSLLLKRDFSLRDLVGENEETEWVKKYRTAQRAIARGQFRKSLKFLKKIDSNFPVQPAIVRGIALLNTQLGYLEEIGPAWRRYAGLAGLTELESVEAAALAQLFSTAPQTAEIKIVRVTFEVTDFSKVLEAALSTPRFTSVTGLMEDPFEEGPAPRNAFHVLDRPPVSASELNIDNVSDITSELMLYGKQTDREARLEWIVAQYPPFEETRQLIQSTFGGLIFGAPVEQELGWSNAVSQTLNWNWHLPPGVSKIEHSELVKQKCRRVFLEDWAQLPFTILGNKSPAEAAQILDFQLELKALLVVLEQTPQAQIDDGAAIAALRDQLKIPAPAEFELAQLPGASVADVSPFQQQYLQVEKLTDQELLALQAESMAIGNMRVLRHVVLELLKRPEQAESPRDLIYSLLAQMTDDEKEALEYLSKARSEAKKHDRPIGLYLVQEFEFRLRHGMTEKLPALMQTIQMHHLREPDVEYHLARVLERHGLLRGRGQGMEESEMDEALPEKSGGKLWAGGALESQSSPVIVDSKSEANQPSKLWLPD